MNASGPFDPFNLGPVDEIVIALRDVLAGQEKLAQWTRGRIYRSELLTIPPGIDAPAIVVGSMTAQPVFTPNGEIEMSVPVGIDVTWWQPVRILGDDEPSIDSVRAFISRAVVANYYLKVPRFGMRRLLKRIEEFRPIDYSGITESADGGPALLHFLMSVEYRLLVNAATHELVTEYDS